MSATRCFDEWGPKASKGALANKTSFVADPEKARANIALATAKGLEVKQRRLKQRPCPLTFSFLEAVINTQVSMLLRTYAPSSSFVKTATATSISHCHVRTIFALSQMSFDETDTFCVKLMELNDGKAVWCKSAPAGKHLVWMMDAYRLMDPALHGITTGTRLNDGGHIVDTQGLYFKVAYNKDLQDLPTPLPRARAPKTARAPRSPAPTPSVPATALPVDKDGMITHPSLPDGIFALAAKPSKEFMRSDAALGFKVLYAFDVQGIDQPQWYPGTITMAMTGKTSGKKKAARKEKVKGEATVEVRWDMGGKEDSAVVHDCYSTSILPPVAGYWCIAGTREQLATVDLDATAPLGDEAEEAEEEEAAEEAEDGEEQQVEEEQGEDGEDESIDLSDTTDTSAGLSFGGAAQTEDGSEVKLWGLTYVLAHAEPGQGVMKVVDAWKRLLRIVTIAWAEAIVVMSR